MKIDRKTTEICLYDLEGTVGDLIEMLSMYPKDAEINIRELWTPSFGDKPPDKTEVMVIKEK